MHDRRYNVTLSPKLDDTLAALAHELSTSKAEVMRKALMLLEHAVDAKEVKLVSKNGTSQTVLLK